MKCPRKRLKKIQVKLDSNKRRAGIFVPLFALRTENDLGVGDTGALREMVDRCKEWGISVLQILPINETSADNSPYMAISAMAVEPSTIEIKPNVIPGLTLEDYDAIATPEILKEIRQGPVNYRIVKRLKLQLLELSFNRFLKSRAKATITLRQRFEGFCHREAAWLGSYTLFRLIGEQHGHFCWEMWPEEHRTIQNAEQFVKNLPPTESKTFIQQQKFYAYVQWVAFEQWIALKNYAHSEGVHIMGDIPFGINRQSVDVWAQPQMFDLHWSGGAPPEPFFKPDKFTAVWGQNWGIPIYNWSEMGKNRFDWWRRRVDCVSRLFHLFRIDHVLGFYRIYSFPWQPNQNAAFAEKTKEQVLAEHGDLPRFIPGDDNKPEEAKINQTQGEKLLKMVIESAGDSSIIAEDLGVVPNYMRPSLTTLGIPGFKIPMFERDEQTHEFRSPEKYPALSVTTLGTHDHDTAVARWHKRWDVWKDREKRLQDGTLTPEFDKEAHEALWDLYRAQRFCKLDDKEPIAEYEPVVREAILQRLLEANSFLSIIMITDLLGIDLRFNVPGPVAETNWSERLPYTVDQLHNEPSLEHIRAFLKRTIIATKRI